MSRSKPFFSTFDSDKDRRAQQATIRRTATTMDELAQACRKGVSESLGDKEAAVLEEAAKICRRLGKAAEVSARKIAADEKRVRDAEARIAPYFGEVPDSFDGTVDEMAGAIYRVFAATGWNAAAQGRDGYADEARAARWLDRAMTPEPGEASKPAHPIALALQRALRSECSFLADCVARRAIKRADERAQTIAEAADEVLAELRRDEASARQTHAALIERAIETLERERGAGSAA